MRCTLDQLPPSLRSQAERQLKAPASIPRNEDIDKRPRLIAKQTMRKMTKTEAEYEQRLIPIYGRENVHFEGLSIRLKNGHRYTPDFVVRNCEGFLLYEVKGGYRLGSYQRARLAFDQARIEWPEWTFVWAEKTQSGWKES